MLCDDAWKTVVEAFGRHGKRVDPRLRGKRRERIERLLSEGYDADDLVAAIEGYVHVHEGLDPKPDGFNPRKWFTPDSVFRLEKIDGRIELGLDGPWVKPMSREESVKARQEAARKRVEAARKERSTTPLRAVEGF